MIRHGDVLAEHAGRIVIGEDDTYPLPSARVVCDVCGAYGPKYFHEERYRYRTKLGGVLLDAVRDMPRALARTREGGRFVRVRRRSVLERLGRRGPSDICGTCMDRIDPKRRRVCVFFFRSMSRDEASRRLGKLALEQRKRGEQRSEMLAWNAAGAARCYGRPELLRRVRELLVEARLLRQVGAVLDDAVERESFGRAVRTLAEIARTLLAVDA